MEMFITDLLNILDMLAGDGEMSQLSLGQSNVRVGIEPKNNITDSHIHVMYHMRHKKAYTRTNNYLNAMYSMYYMFICINKE